jgi:D-glycero-alpha-D-manno-heptose-7-phosphate kinase
MIRVSAPLRLPLGGGGTDLPAYYSRRGGFLVAAAIADSVQVTLGPARPGRGDAGHRRGGGPPDPFVAQAMYLLGAPAAMEVRIESSVPPGSGLGGSGAVLVALAHALRVWRGEAAPRRLLAEEAFRIERERMGRPVGKQDAYAAAYGGVLALHIDPDGTCRPQRLKLERRVARFLEDSLLLADTGGRRDAASILAAQERAGGARASLEALDRIRSLGRRASAGLAAGRPGALGPLFRRHWDIKRRLSSAPSTPEAERILAMAERAGARGGKLIGAGGGGFVLLECGRARGAVEGALAAAGVVTRRVRLRGRGSRREAA